MLKCIFSYLSEIMCVQIWTLLTGWETNSYHNKV
jgi:hypothetical protein